VKLTTGILYTLSINLYLWILGRIPRFKQGQRKQPRKEENKNLKSFFKKEEN